MSDKVEAARKALEEAQAALAAAEAEAAATPAPADSGEPDARDPDDPAGATPSAGDPAPSPGASGVAEAPAPQPPGAPLVPEEVDAIRAGYAFAQDALEIGALVNGDALPDVPVRIPIAMTNRHGLVAGATGTGKTKTLQVLAEQLSAAGVPVFAADIKGDLSGIASPGAPSEQLLERTRGIGQDWTPQAFPTEYFALGGKGDGVPIRASVKSFGPLMLSKVLGLNPTQESSLGLVFHYAERAGLELVTLADLRAVLTFLVSDEGKADLADLGGLSKATAGVILRELVGFADQGADVFFGVPEIDVDDFFQVRDGRGVVSLLEVRSVLGTPELFSTFLMWLLSRLYESLPEVGDQPKPKLVFFFDEAHLLFTGASKDFLAVITQVVRLIRSRGVGIFFVTQTPKDVPGDVLAQLGSRIQHQLRAHTPDDAKALKATVSTYPTSAYDLGEVLTTLATGEAVVTVMNEKGAPSPVAWTRVRAPQGSMEPTPAEQVAQAVQASPLLPRYRDPEAHESTATALAERTAAAQDAGARSAAAALAAKEAEREAARQAAAAQKAAEREAARAAKEAERRAAAARKEAERQERERQRAEERLRRETINAGVKVARSIVGRLFSGRR